MTLDRETTISRIRLYNYNASRAHANRGARHAELRLNGSGGGVAPTELALTVAAQREFFASGATKSVGWRCEQIQKLCTAIAQASDRFSETQAADGVVPCVVPCRLRQVQVRL